MGGVSLVCEWRMKKTPTMTTMTTVMMTTMMMKCSKINYLVDLDDIPG